MKPIEGIHHKPLCAVGPATAPDWLRSAVLQGGGVFVPLEDAEVLVWWHSDAGHLREALDAAPNLHWIQLPSAGIDGYMSVVDSAHIWTCAKGVYAEPVAEHALTLALAGLRNVAHYARERSWIKVPGANLYDANVSILGGGGVARALIDLLQPFRARITVIRRQEDVEMEGVQRVVSVEHLDEALYSASVVIVAAALTRETRGIINSHALQVMRDCAWIVNVARGALIVTPDLVAALDDGQIAGASLDVTDPEPLPKDHRLWKVPNCIVTPHVGNTMAMHRPLLEAFTRENIRSYSAGEPLRGTVDVRLGY